MFVKDAIDSRRAVCYLEMVCFKKGRITRVR